MKRHKYIGGLGWPFNLSPGFVLVVRVTWDDELSPVTYRADIVAESLEISVSGLRLRCAEWEKEYGVSVWYADTGNAPMLGAFYEGVGAVGVSSVPAVGLTSPPYVDRRQISQLCFQSLRELCRFDRKVLHFGRSRVVEELQRLPMGKAIKVERYPVLSGVGYLSIGMHMWMVLEGRIEEKGYLGRIIEEIESVGIREDDSYVYNNLASDSVFNVIGVRIEEMRLSGLSGY